MLTSYIREWDMDGELVMCLYSGVNMRKYKVGGVYKIIDNRIKGEKGDWVSHTSSAFIPAPNLTLLLHGVL